jgi:hypothetical protein
MAGDNEMNVKNPTRSAMPRPSVGLLLLCIFCIGLGLRLWAINFGLPYDLTFDEIHEILRALKLGAGEYYWGSGGKGGLYLILFVEYGILYSIWWLTGRIGNPTDFALLYVQDPTAFYLAGRITVAIMGALTCIVIYRIGTRLSGQKAGLVAALIGATAYFHGFWSHYINVDIGMTLAIWTSILAYLNYEDTDNSRWLIAAGALAGVGMAFKIPAVVIFIPLFLAIATPLSKWSLPARPIKEIAILLLATTVTVAAIAPEILFNLGMIIGQFSNILGLNQPNGTLASAPGEIPVDAAIHDFVIRGPGYLTILFNKYNLILTIFAALGGVLGIWRRQRWTVILCAYIVIFLVAMSVADRPGNERYMMPIVPGLWLIASQAVLILAGKRYLVKTACIIAIVSLPLFGLIHQNYMWTQPDTRVLAKDWIEANVPEGAKILMDGMEHRFIQSPPLNPNESTIARRVGRITDDNGAESRGVSENTLTLWARGAALIDGPKYDLHSTVWGIKVEDLSYYPAACFDYVITSFDILRYFANPEKAALYPKGAKFYKELPSDSRYQLVFSIESVPWKIQGPKISVYKVINSCG